MAEKCGWGHTDTVCSITGEENRTMSNQVTQALHLEALNLRRPHARRRSSSIPLLLHQSSKYIPNATRKDPSVPVTREDEGWRCSEVRRQEQNRRMPPWYPMAYMVFFKRKIGQPTQSFTLSMKSVSAKCVDMKNGCLHVCSYAQQMRVCVSHSYFFTCERTEEANLRGRRRRYENCFCVRVCQHTL